MSGFYVLPGIDGTVELKVPKEVCTDSALAEETETFADQSHPASACIAAELTLKKAPGEEHPAGGDAEAVEADFIGPEELTSEDREESFKNGEEESSSEGSVISETDLRLEEEVRKERAVARKKKNNGAVDDKASTGRKSVKKRSASVSSEDNSDDELDAMIRRCERDSDSDDAKRSKVIDGNNRLKSAERSSPASNKKKKKSSGGYTPEYMYVSDEEQEDEKIDEEGPAKNELAVKNEEETKKPKGKHAGGNRGISTEESKRMTKKSEEGTAGLVETGEQEDGEERQEEPKSDDGSDEEIIKMKRSKVDKLLATRLDLSDSGKEESSSESGRKQKTRSGSSKPKQNKRKVIFSSESDESSDGEGSSPDSFEVISADSDSSVTVDSDDEETSRTSRSRARSSNRSRKRKEAPDKEKNRKKKARIIEDSDEEDEDEDEKQSDDENAESKKRRGPKPIMSKDKLAKETVDAEKAEKERRKRIEAKQKEFNGIEFTEGVDLASALTNAQSSQRLKSVVLDPDKNSEDPCPVAVHASLVKCLKKHQAEGIQFLYNCTIESLDRLGEEGGGAILAHCMGLGKTLQVIAFLHTIMMHPKIGEKVKHVLVIVPKNVVLNWYKEFEKWLDNDDIDRDLATINIMELDSLKEYSDRHVALQNWYKNEEPSVMIIGYDMFRILTRGDDDCGGKGKKNEMKRKPSKQARKLAKLQPDFRRFLQDPGPDLIVCDEAHKLKNDDSALSKTMNKIQTKRRICLTGTPLQNNLMEYHCMVNFVKQGLVGTKAEFANRFANIINRGRLKDATASEVRFMKRRCHVLCEHLKGVVQRVDYRVLMEAIPPKQEYVINVRLTPRQVKLYRAFLERVGQDSAGLSKRLLPDYHILSRIWTHPYQLIAHEIIAEKKASFFRWYQEDKEELDDFVDDGDETPSVIETSDDDVIALDDVVEGSSNTGRSSSKVNGDMLTKPIRKSKRLAGEEADEVVDGPRTPPEFRGWYAETGLVTDQDENDFSLSNKLTLLVQIIKKCEEIGDKILVFSQSIESLTLIKRMLHYMDSHDLWFADGHEAAKSSNETWGWTEGRDYMVIDGQVQSGKRQEVQTKFNNPNNLRARLMLISTRAGSLGTNMVAANRVIIFDACWNPSHDTQSLFRVYRFGQTKPVYIYRFIAQGTMEERIYRRQVTKESTALRVIDEQQIQRHFDGHDLMELYSFEPDELDESGDNSSKRPPMAPPKDRLLRDIILLHKDAIVNYLQHDSLFEDLEEEKLTEQECQEAWDDYEREKTMVAYSKGAYLAYEHQLAAEQNQLEMARRTNENNVLSRLQMDEVYMHAFAVQGMEADTAMKLAYMKISLDSLLPYIPMDMRGTITGFGIFFISLITDTAREKRSVQDLMSKALVTFRQVVELTRNLPACVPILRHLYRNSSQFFDPTKPPP
ncbi:unnamed protein product [Toxocara canis]|uniref:Transcriptional regulator ATRX homolog n=1 Tax=Toxocara canis TaxID=6265 RepID=A0A183UA26_TOXCA|nr:unnamed protein product [Toxocara canis]